MNIKLFYRFNMLTRRFSKCSVAVKLQLFKTFCLCFYDIGLWCNFTSEAFAKLQSAYVKCVKIFFRYSKFCTVLCVCFYMYKHGLWLPDTNKD